MRDRVRYILTDLLGTVEVDRDGEFSFRHDSARIFVGVRPFDEGTVSSPVRVAVMTARYRDCSQLSWRMSRNPTVPTPSVIPTASSSHSI